jgi:hypothetical protein
VTAESYAEKDEGMKIEGLETGGEQTLVGEKSDG